MAAGGALAIHGIIPCYYSCIDWTKFQSSAAWAHKNRNIFQAIELKNKLSILLHGSASPLELRTLSKSISIYRKNIVGL